jgi:phosphate transport system permease protein
MQTVFQHILPLAKPGIKTGSIIGMAQALGETDPLQMIGMVAFIVDPPTVVTDAASSLPVLIYLWADRAELAFDMRTAAAILVLLFFLVLMNSLAILLRKRFESRW